MLNQKLQQKLLQKLSPQQILLMKLLQIPSISLDQRIKQEIEENPALEDAADPELSDYGDSLPSEEEDHAGDEVDEIMRDQESFNYEDYFEEEDIPSYKLRSSNSSPGEDRPDIPFAIAASFHESLIAQLGLRNLNDTEYMIGLTIIGNIDDSGYLQRDVSAMVDDLAFSQNIQTTEEEIRKVLEVIQELDPPGTGARNLQECLIIQLKRGEVQNEHTALAIQILEKYFEEFTRKHYDKILRRAHATDAELKAAMDLILKLNPKPGNSVGESNRSNQYIIPDFFIYINDDELELTVNSRNAPDLRLSRTYLDMFEEYSSGKSKNNQQKEALQFIKQKLDSAKWFIDAIKQRENTLLFTMNAIMQFQKEYFLTGDETRLKPMILKDIAEIVNLDISTISRVANSKYVQTPYGTFLLKSFFSESLQTDSGEEVSTREIKKILSDHIAAERKDKPLTDEELTEILIKQGYNIARRTVAKYREQLSIPVARLRKEL